MSEASPVVRSADRSALALAARLTERAPKGLFRFLGVGVCGLTVDIAVLWLLEQAGLGHAAARAGSLGVATLVTWALNRQFTFDESGRRPPFELGRYALVALVAQSVNYFVFLGLCEAFPQISHSLAAFAGAVTATAFSYSGQRFFTFAQARRD